MAHYVVCLVCGKKFDRDKYPVIKIGTRYAHTECAGEQTQQFADKDSLYQYIKTKDPKYNFILIEKQLENMMKAHPDYTYSGILKSLQYFLDIENGEWDTEKGIAIVPYVYQKAFDYFYNLYCIQKKNEGKIIPTSVQTVKIFSPRTTVEPKRMWKWEVDDEA